MNSFIKEIIVMVNSNILKQPLISVCILNYNGGSRLPKVIPSILSQDYKNIEFIFLDNSSSDNSLNYIKQFKNIRIIESNCNLGISGGRNELSKFAKGEYIFFLDNDIELTDKRFVSTLLKDYQDLEDKTIGVLFPLSRMEDESVYCNVGLSFNKLQKIRFDSIFRTGFILKSGFEGSAFFMQKSIFTELGGFDDKYPICMNDADLSMRLYNMGYTIYVDTNLYTIHHGMDSRTSISVIGWKYQYYFAAFMRSLLKNYKLKNLIKWGVISACWIILKAIKLSVKYRSILPLKGLVLSIKKFFNDYSDTMMQRKYLQKVRKLDYDYFLEIK